MKLIGFYFFGAKTKILLQLGTFEFQEIECSNEMKTPSKRIHNLSTVGLNKRKIFFKSERIYRKWETIQYVNDDWY